MIDLTPLDVRKKKGDFRRGLRGYEADEVDGFLDMVAERMEELVRENTRLRERTTELAQAVEVFRGREQAMNEALVSAQQLREEIRQQAQKDSELSVREARARGDQLIAEAKKEVERERAAVQRIEAQRDRFLRSYRNFLEGQLGELSVEEERVLRSRTGELDPEVED